MKNYLIREGKDEIREKQIGHFHYILALKLGNGCTLYYETYFHVPEKRLLVHELNNLLALWSHTVVHWT
jgi:hypothetical protein